MHDCDHRDRIRQGRYGDQIDRRLGAAAIDELGDELGEALLVVPVHARIVSDQPSATPPRARGVPPRTA